MDRIFLVPSCSELFISLQYHCSGGGGGGVLSASFCAVSLSPTGATTAPCWYSQPVQYPVIRFISSWRWWVIFFLFPLLLLIHPLVSFFPFFFGSSSSRRRNGPFKYDLSRSAMAACTSASCPAIRHLASLSNSSSLVSSNQSINQFFFLFLSFSLHLLHSSSFCLLDSLFSRVYRVIYSTT